MKKNLVRAVGFALWLAGATFAATSLTAWHSVGLPQQNAGKTALGGSAGQWHLTHYLSADCACSQALGRHLIERGPVSASTGGVAAGVAGGVTEDVVLIGTSDARADATLRDALSRRGFPTVLRTADAASVEDGVDAVPLLTIRAPDGNQRFRGGYRERGASADVYRDLTILSDLMASRTVAPFRVYGCATSRRLRALLDPLSLRSLSFPEAQ